MKLLLQREVKQLNDFDIKNNQLDLKMLIENTCRPFMRLSNTFWKFSLYYGRFLADRSSPIKSKNTIEIGGRIRCHP